MARTKALIEAELAKEKERSKAFQQDAMRAEKSYEAAAEENNHLRDVAMNLTREIARWEGYLDGIEDAKPPRMVEAERDNRRPLGAASQDEPRNYSGFTSASSRSARQWWHR